ncbi:MAG: hypothetical protein J2P39_11185 [Candidatus Dormibacteraeota bacterium]|nr:hypothetical protein [Candidatus Dormibacteraeota bacterium]
MDANAYANEIEGRFPDVEKLKAIRKEIEADPELDENDKLGLSGRIGSYLVSLQPDPPGA